MTGVVDVEQNHAAGKRCFFILTCARSGSTSLARILDTGLNTTCAVEPAPNLNRETRLTMDGRLGDLDAVIERDIAPRVEEQLGTVEVYGEKNLTYGPFVGAMNKRFNRDGLACRFVFLHRDGRDSVRSMIDWHERKFGTVYRECRETGALSEDAVRNAGALRLAHDHSDFSRPRPGPDETLHDSWDLLSRAEMIAYSWARVNEIYADAVEQLPESHWTKLDYTGVTAEDIERVMRFCGIEPDPAVDLSGMLGKRINSLVDRQSAPGSYPEWPEWDSGRRDRFELIAGSMMRRLGYWGDDKAEWWRPEGACTLDRCESIARTHDVDAYIERLAVGAGERVSLRVPVDAIIEANEHGYTFDRAAGTCYSKISLDRLRRTLEACGFGVVSRRRSELEVVLQAKRVAGGAP